MFTSKEASRIREEFWTTFGKYMSPVPFAEGTKNGWLNYQTGISGIYFRMNAGKNSAIISITMEHRDHAIQELHFAQFVEIKSLLFSTLEEEWIWQLHTPMDGGKVISRIYKEIQGVSVFNKDQWPMLISFFKPRIIALDRFWENAKYSFDSLR